MGYNEQLADRVKLAVGKRLNVTTKRMFGGLAFMLDGKMFCGVTHDDLMVRVGLACYAAALSEPHVRPMDFTGRPMNGYIFVGPGGSGTVSAVEKWVERAVAFVATLDQKPAKKK